MPLRHRACRPDSSTVQLQQPSAADPAVIMLTRVFFLTGPWPSVGYGVCGAWLVWLPVWLPATARGLRLVTVGGLPTPWYQGSTGTENGYTHPCKCLL
jgi:hypothetical protein